MIIINSPTIKEIAQDEILVETQVCTSEKEKVLWFRTNAKYKQYVTTERMDGALVAVLLYAMLNGEDIKCNGVISQKLYMNITQYLIPFLCRINSNLKNINVICEKSAEYLENAKHIGTGISCGIDSLSTIIYHSKKGLPSFDIDTLTLFNSGYYGMGKQSHDNYDKYLAQSIEFSQKYSYDFLWIDSNINDWCVFPFSSSHTYLTCSLVLMMQKYFSTYYYSSGYSVYDFAPKFEDPAYYDVFLLSCISTETLSFVSSCSIMTRIEKTKLVLQNSHKDFLYVCTSGILPNNCGRCEKCIRTILAGDSLGCLKKLENKFDLSLYKRFRYLYIAYALRRANKNSFYREIIESFKKDKKGSILIAHAFILIPSSLDIRHFVFKLKKAAKKIIKKLGDKK